EEDFKNRSDHRHHALDALVVALTDRGLAQAMSRWNKYNRELGDKEIPKPWENLRASVEPQMEAILVSHRKVDRVITVKNSFTKKEGRVFKNQGSGARGALHKDTI